MNEKVKPWMAVVLNPTEGEQQVFYFDDYLDTWTFAKKNPHKRIALGVAIMITGKAESVGIDMLLTALAERTDV